MYHLTFEQEIEQDIKLNGYAYFLRLPNGEKVRLPPEMVVRIDDKTVNYELLITDQEDFPT